MVGEIAVAKPVAPELLRRLETLVRLRGAPRATDRRLAPADRAKGRIALAQTDASPRDTALQGQVHVTGQLQTLPGPFGNRLAELAAAPACRLASVFEDRLALQIQLDVAVDAFDVAQQREVG